LSNWLKNIKKMVEKRFGLSIMRTEKLDAVYAHHSKMLEFAYKCNENSREVDTLSGIVFSKDRPLQLFSLLTSYLEKVDNPCTLTVLYSASSPHYLKAYLTISELFSRSNIYFVKEQDFRSDLLGMLFRVNQSHLFFLVDDIIFVEPVDLQRLSTLSTPDCVPSLRLGKNTRRCYTQNVKQNFPSSFKWSANSEVYEWCWADGEYDWGYPISVDGNIFRTSEIQLMANVCSYKAPNSFEQSLQWFAKSFLHRQGVCFEKSVIINIPFNKIQSENNNISGSVDPSLLLKYWEDGFELDLLKYYGCQNESAHQEFPLHIKPRSSTLL
jgi:hypothetical protein